MIQKLFKKYTFAYQMSFFILMLAVSAAMLYFWKLGYIDGSRNTEIHQATYIINNFENKKSIDSLKSLISDESMSKSIKKIDSIEVDLNKVDHLIELSTYKEVKEKTQKVKTEIVGMLSHPRTNKIFSVFNEKLEKFNRYVLDNEWKTLSRMSNRVLSITRGGVRAERIDSATKEIEKDFLKMSQITEKSVLKRVEKSEIVSRLQSLNIEIKMLRRYVKTKTQINKSLDGYKVIIHKWLTLVKPELSLEKLRLEQIGKYYVFALLGILAVNALLLMFSLFYGRVGIKKSQKRLEKELQSYITEGLLAGDSKVLNDFNPSFQNFTRNTGEYIQRRMSFGSIFQETIPFSSIMLDQNLKVIWANQTFCETWELSEEEIHKEYLSWDFLSKLTNLGDQDPVLEALKHQIAGIYQIQVKINNESSLMPYEMYVSPIEYNEESRIVLYFYPLINLEDTITDQAKSIVNPVRHSLDLLVKDEFNGENLSNLKKEFEIAGIAELYEKFESLHEIHNSEKREISESFEALEFKFNKFARAISDFDVLNTQSTDNNKGQVESLKLFKEHIIELSDNSKTYEKLNRDIQAIFGNLMNRFSVSQNDKQKLSNIVKEVSSGVPDINSMKDDYKNLKTEVYESRNKLSHSIGQMIFVRKKISDAETLEKFDQTFHKINTEFGYLDDASKQLDRKLTNLEVSLSKIEMIVENMNKEITNVDQGIDRSYLENISQHYQSLSSENRKLAFDNEGVESAIIERMHEFYAATKNNIQNAELADEVLGTLSIDQSLESPGPEAIN